MYNNRKGWPLALLLALLTALPGIPALDDGGRGPPDIVFNVSRFADGNRSAELVFSESGNLTAPGVTLPNGATVLEARMNISSAPLSAGGTDCPQNLTLDIGNDGVADWAFTGKGYGDMGHQYMFSTGENSTKAMSGPDNTSRTFIQLPADAQVSAAVCNFTSLGVASTVSILGGQNAVRSPWDIGQYRMQWLYNASEIGRTGHLDKLSWHVNSGSGTATLSNFKLFVGHTPLTNTSDTFDDNWGGLLPTKVIDEKSYNVSDVDGWITIDFPGTYYYNNTMSLLIEMSFSERTGTNFLLMFKYLGTGAGTRRLYNNVDYTSATGTLDNPDSPLHYDFGFIFSEGYCMTVDLGGDSVPDLETGMWDWNMSTLDIAPVLGTYLQTAAVNLTDGYGNRFIRMPIVVRTSAGGGARISNLSISYDYTAVVDKNPVYEGGLAEALDHFLPSTPDRRNTTIEMTAASLKPGRVALSGLYVDFRPPVHDPDLNLRSPGAYSIVMDENSTQEFLINATDEWGYPISTVWYVNGLETARDVPNMTFFAGYDSAGEHTVAVTVDNTLRTLNLNWNVTVRNVNRPPFISSFRPGAEITLNETERVDLSVEASDPDAEDTDLRYQWTVDTVDQGASGNGFRFATNFTSAGLYIVRAKVSDPGGLSASQSWRITVLNVNVPPQVDSLSPDTIPIIHETESVNFSVEASDFDGQALSYGWYLDGAPAGNGTRYTFRTGYDSAGEHSVRVVISDGEANISRDWSITVDNLNRPPSAVIDRPAAGSEALDTVPVNFSGRSSSDPDADALRYRWLEGARELSTAAEFESLFTRGAHEVTLEVTDQNRATSRATVKFMVRYVRLTVTTDRDILLPKEGNRLTFTVWVNNTGDANATQVGVEFLVDGQSTGTQTIDSLEGGDSGSVAFQWKAKKGTHNLTVKVAGRSWNSTVTVAAIPAPPAEDMTLPLIVVAVVIAAAAGGLAFVMVRRRKGRAAGDDAAEAPGPAGPSTTAPAEVPAPSSPEPPADEARDDARELINSTQEKAADLLENPRKGVDVTAAMVKLEKAQALFDKGDYDGAMSLAAEADASLEPAPAAKEARKAPAEKAEARGGRACPSCGENLDPGWEVCPVCGEKV